MLFCTIHTLQMHVAGGGERRTVVKVHAHRGVERAGGGGAEVVEARARCGAHGVVLRAHLHAVRVADGLQAAEGVRAGHAGGRALVAAGHRVRAAVVHDLDLQRRRGAGVRQGADVVMVDRSGM